MRLTVVLVNWRDPTQTIRCVRTLRSWHSLKPALVVVDNESTDGSRRALAEVCATEELGPSVRHSQAYPDETLPPTQNKVPIGSAAADVEIYLGRP
jgi:hypothetical protein